MGYWLLKGLGFRVGDSWHCAGPLFNRVSGCMSVAGCGRRSRFLGRWFGSRGSRRGNNFRARGLDGSPRNGEMSRTGVREGLKWK